MPHDMAPLGEMGAETAVRGRIRVDDDSLFDVYSRHFMTVPANGADLRERFYRLRYQVYCVENPFEDAATHPDGLETDEFDEHSIQSLLIHIPTGMVAGGIRIILPQREGAPRDMPVWRICDREAYAQRDLHLPVSRTAEVSRNAVSKEFRHHFAHHCGGGDELRRIIPHISLGLLGAVIRMCAENGITHVCAAMEPPMLRMFARLGVHFLKLGGPVDYHGTRQPAYADLDSLLARTFVERPDVWAIMTKRGAYWPLNRPLAAAMTKAPGHGLYLSSVQ